MTKWKDWVYEAITALIGEKVAGFIVRFVGILIVIITIILIAWFFLKPG